MVGSGRDYELFCARELRRYGFKNITMTKTSGDFGVDIVCEKSGERWAVQCKYYSSHVGVAAVQQAAAGRAMYDCTRAMVMTNSVFTSQARELAEQNGVELWEELECSPASDAAKAMMIALAVFYVIAAGCIGYTVISGGGNPWTTVMGLAAPGVVGIVWIAVKNKRDG